MRRLIFSSLMTLSFASFAAPVVVESTDGTGISMANIERSITVDSSLGRINVVEMDNGGSTDIASAAYPSELFVTYYQDGEMNNVKAVFDLGPIYSLKSAVKKGNKIEVVADVKNINLKLSTKKITVDISDLVKKAGKPEITVGEFEDQTLKATVTVSEKLGEE